MKAVDFFCGAGGLTKGLRLAGINVLVGIDQEERCRETYNFNNKPSKFVCSDIKKVNIDELTTQAEELCTEPNELLFAGCAPCQPFSPQRKSKEYRSDTTILGEFGRLIELFLPGQILMENVPGISRVKGFSTFKRFLKLLDRNGYSIAWDILNAKDYGIPQNRNRLVLIAMRGISATLPEKTHGPGLLKYITVKDAIAKFPRIKAGKCDANIPNHEAALLSEINLERLRHTPRNGGSRNSWPEKLILTCHKKGYNGHTDVYGRMSWNKPAPTLTGKCNSISNGRYGHPSQNRAITLREAAALQTFPDDYVFFGQKGNIAQQIGNAVPVVLGKILGDHIVKLRANSKTQKHSAVQQSEAATEQAATTELY
ncbi:MAG: DNA cytosine methyltransferase [Candidatus Methylomirabilis sp.]|nr:DNA cytosine methyltransferase [Deltaproteobacteria bacterium]